MKVYLRILIPIFITVFTYTVLSVVWGEKGVDALKQLTQETERITAHVASLQQRSDELDSELKNLAYDAATIAVYAHDMGYVFPNEQLVKLANVNKITDDTRLFAGTPITVRQPDFLADRICKTLSVSLGIFAVLVQMLVGWRSDSTKKRRI